MHCLKKEEEREREEEDEEEEEGPKALAPHFTRVFKADPTKLAFVIYRILVKPRQHNKVLNKCIFFSALYSSPLSKGPERMH